MWELDYKASWAPKNWWFWTVVLEKTLESPSDCKEIQPVHPKEISPEYSLEGSKLKLKPNSLATWCKELTHLKRPWCWERLKAGGEGDDKGWDGWMASPTWIWVWVNSGSWWWTGRPGVLQSMGSQRVRMTERVNRTESEVLYGILTQGKRQRPRQASHALTKTTAALLARCTRQTPREGVLSGLCCNAAALNLLLFEWLTIDSWIFQM